MGIFDKINEAIGQIQDLAEKAGVKGQADGAAAGSSTPAPADPPRPGGLAARMGGPAGLDPLRVLDESTVAEVLGTTVTGAYDHVDAEWLGRTYQLDDGGHAELRFLAAPEGQTFDAPAWWGMLVDGATDTEPLHLGDQGLISGDAVFVRTGGMVLHTLVASAGGVYDTAAAQRLAASALAALG